MIPDPAPSDCLGDLAEGSIRVPPPPHVWVCLGAVLWCLWGEPLSLVYLRVVDTSHLPKRGDCRHLGLPLCFYFWRVLLPNSHCSSTTTVGGGSSCPQSSGPDVPPPSMTRPPRSHSLLMGAAHMGVSAAWLFLPQVQLLTPKPLLNLTPFSGSVSTSTNTWPLLPVLWAPPPESLPGCSLWSCVCVSHVCVLGGWALCPVGGVALGCNSGHVYCSG